MPGNEKETAKFLVLNLGKISLPHLGAITSIGMPITEKGKFVEIKNARDVDPSLSPENSIKKPIFI